MIMSNKEPLVSVVIPCYSKQRHLLLRAINSVKNQTYKNIEIIVVDDDTLTAPQARNKGIRKAKGRYIAFLDADDEWAEHKIEMQADYMNKNPDCGLCISFSWDKRFNMSRVSMPKSDVTFNDLIKSFNLSSTSSYMVRSVAFTYLQQWFDDELESGQEYDLALRLAYYGWKIHTIQRVLVKQNASDGQISVNWKKKITGQMQFYKRWHKELGIVGAIKTIGLIKLFFFGYLVGTDIYSIITRAKEMYENV